MVSSVFRRFDVSNSRVLGVQSRDTFHCVHLATTATFHNLHNVLACPYPSKQTFGCKAKRNKGNLSVWAICSEFRSKFESVAQRLSDHGNDQMMVAHLPSKGGTCNHCNECVTAKEASSEKTMIMNGHAAPPSLPSETPLKKQLKTTPHKTQWAIQDMQKGCQHMGRLSA